MCWKGAVAIFLHHDRGGWNFFENVGQNCPTCPPVMKDHSLMHLVASVHPSFHLPCENTFKASSVGMQLSDSDCMFVNNGIFSASLAHLPITFNLTCGYKSVFLFLMHFVHIKLHIGSPVFSQKSPVFFRQISWNSVPCLVQTNSTGYELYYDIMLHRLTDRLGRFYASIIIQPTYGKLFSWTCVFLGAVPMNDSSTSIMVAKVVQMNAGDGYKPAGTLHSFILRDSLLFIKWLRA